MQRRQIWLIMIVMVALVAQLKAAELSKALKKQIKKKLKGNSEFENNFDLFIYTLENSNLKENYVMEKYIGEGSKGEAIFLEVTTKGLAYQAKVILDKSSAYTFCENEKIVETLNQQKFSYISIFKDYIVYQGTRNLQPFYSCIVITEIPRSFLNDRDLYPKNDDISKKSNAKKMFRLCGRIIKAFAEINFKGKILHGDINPSSIRINYKPTNIKSEFEYEPVITNFHLILKNEKQENNIDDGIVRYEDKYRSPEMNNPGEKGVAITKHNFTPSVKFYYYSSEFTEDVFALGIVIEDYIKLFSQFIDNNLCEITNLRKLVRYHEGRKRGI